MKNSLLVKVVGLDITSTFLDSIFSMIIVVLCSQQPNNTTLLAIISVLLLVPSLFSAVFGAFADKIEQRMSYIILSNVSRIILFLVMAYLAKDKITTLVLFAIVAMYIIINFFGQFENSLFVPVVPALTTSEELPIIYSKVSSLQSGVKIIAPIIGAMCLQVISFSYLSLTVATIEGMIVISLFLLRPTLNNKLANYYQQKVATSSSSETSTVLNNMKVGAKDIFKNKQFKYILFFITMVNGLGASLFLVISLLASNYQQFIIYNLSYTISILMSLTSGAMFLSGILFSKYLVKLSFAQLNLILSSCWLVIFTSGYFKSIYIFALTLIVMGTFTTFLGAKFKAAIVNTLDKEFMSSYMGVISTVLGFTPIVFTSLLSLLIFIFKDIIVIIKYGLLPVSAILFLLSFKYYMNEKKVV